VNRSWFASDIILIDSEGSIGNEWTPRTSKRAPEKLIRKCLLQKANRMCSFCKTDHKHYLIKHEESACPFQQSRYCSFCACHGHSTSDCPDAPPSAVQFKKMGSLIPMNRTRTLQLIDTDDAIRSFLQAVSRMPAKAVKSADLRKIAAHYALEKGRRLILLPK